MRLNMSSSTIDVLRHILDETVYLTDHSRELTKAEFIQDETLRRAFSRSIEVIGEAAKQVPNDFRQRYSQIDWRAMAGMRDRPAILNLKLAAKLRAAACPIPSLRP